MQGFGGVSDVLIGSSRLLLMGLRRPVETTLYWDEF
jgi:hypothetical protein